MRFQYFFVNKLNDFVSYDLYEKLPQHNMVVFYASDDWWERSEGARQNILSSSSLGLIEPYFHNSYGPAWMVFNQDGLLIREAYYIHGKLHNPNGIASIEYSKKSQIDPNLSFYAIDGKIIGKLQDFPSIQHCLNHHLMK